MAAALEIRGLRYRYPGGTPALDGVDLTLEPGEAATILGAGGSGKSTLAYVPNGLIPHFFGGNLEGGVRVGELDTRRTPVAEMISLAGLVLQNADAQLFCSTVGRDLAFGLESLAFPPAEIEARIRSVAAALDISHLLSRRPETLSGGEKRLAAIASVLCMGPPLVVLDEPFAGLDRRGSRRVRDALAQAAAGGRTLMVVEHRTGCFLDESDRAVVLDRGRVRYDGTPREALPVLEDLHLVPRYPERPPGGWGAPGETILRVRDLSCRLGGRSVLSDVSFDLASGEAAALVGENGAGKTTLVKHLNGILAPEGGGVFFRGREIGALPPAERARAVGLCLQRPDDQFFQTSVLREIEVGPRRLGIRDPGWQERIVALLDLGPLLQRSPYLLSEGEKRRVALASILLMRPEVLVLDEPTAGLDGPRKEALAGAVREIAGMGVAVLLVTHELGFAMAAAERWIWLEEGRVRADGDAGSVRPAYLEAEDPGPGEAP